MLNRGRHLCSAGRPSRWALAHILVGFKFSPISATGELWATLYTVVFATAGRDANDWKCLACYVELLSNGDDNGDDL